MLLVAAASGLLSVDQTHRIASTVTMRRILKLLSYVVAFTSLWAAALRVDQSFVPLHIIAGVPAALIVSFGLLLLVKLVVGVLSFRSCPEEAELLLQDIERARRGLSDQKLLDS